MERVPWSKSFSDDELVEVLGFAAGQLSVGGFVQVAAAPAAIERELVAGLLELLPQKCTVIVEQAWVLAGLEEGLEQASYYDFESRPDTDVFSALLRLPSLPDLLVVRDDGRPATSQQVAEYTTQRRATLLLTSLSRLLAPSGLNGITYNYEPPLPRVGPIGPRSRPSSLS